MRIISSFYFAALLAVIAGKVVSFWIPLEKFMNFSVVTYKCALAKSLNIIESAVSSTIAEESNGTVPEVATLQQSKPRNYIFQLRQWNKLKEFNVVRSISSK